MRRFLSLFMMLLLALRGLAGDVMAMESPAAHSPAHRVAAVTQQMAGMDHSMAHGLPVNMDMSHAEHAAMTMRHGPDHSADHASASVQCGAADASDCGSHDGHCTTCGLCHTALGQPQWALFNTPVPATIQPRHGTDRFASIAPIALIKPPIFAV
ncbi:hypothetical protein DZC30_09405 [Comamonas testosteroni]|uniref:CopL family metal-binding regulatory protein n=1 Tax=Comamonas testosteroni TaxID=285 RepID=A0A373FQ12_COMTE|nr:hypothetical protein [Comamonas testosteroni]RGE45459.1 hypothetical protein DZC30_09405 [Comamonas testosteroni]